MSANSEVQVIFGAQTAGLVSAINSVKSQIEGLTAPISNIVSAFAGLGEAAVAAFAVDKVIEFTEKYAELGERIERTSLILGITRDQVQELGFAIRMGGGDAETAAMTMGIFEKNIAQAASGSGTAATAFANMGITVKDANGNTRSAIDLLKDMADVVSKVDDANIRAEYGRALLGRGYQNLLPILMEGKAGFDRINEVLDKTNSKLSSDQVAALAESRKKTIELSASWDGLMIALGADTAWTSVKQNAIDFTQEMTGLAKAIGDAGRALTGFLGIGEKNTEPTAINEFNAAAGKLQVAMATASGKAAEVYGPNKPPGKKLASLGKVSGNAAGSGSNPEESQQIQKEKNDLATTLELQKIELAGKKEIDAEKVASGEMSKTEQLNNLRDYTQQEHLQQIEALNAAMDLYDADTVEYRAYLNKKQVLTAQFGVEMDKINLQSVQEQKKQYDVLFNGIKTAMDGMVTGILQGTQTFQQALVRLADNIGIKFAQLAANKLLDWTKNELLSVTVTQTADAAKLASNTAAAGASNALGAAKMIKEIESSAATTYAGVFAFLSPVLGPAAAVPAGVSAGLVGAMTGLVSLDVGAWNLSGDTVAQLHRGEMVVPQTFAQGIRDGSGLGGGDQYSVSVNVSAIDTQTGAQFLKNNAHVIADSMVSQMRLGNSGFKNAMK